MGPTTVTPPIPHQVGSGPTLDHLLDRLQPSTLQLVTAPAGYDEPITDAVIYDAADSTPPAPGAIVLAVGVDHDAGVATLIRQLARFHPSALVAKLADEPSTAVLSAATDAGVAVLTAAPELPWGRLYDLVTTALRGASAPPTPLGQTPLGDLFALANAIAVMVGGATTIEDPHSRVLAYSNLDHPIDAARQATILGRQVPAEWINRLQETGNQRRLWQSDDVVRIDKFRGVRDYLPRLAVAVRAGGEFLGSIWVIAADSSIGPEADQALRDAADIAALHLLRHRSAQDVERRRRSDALLGIVEGRESGERARELLGIDVAKGAAVIAFDVGGAPDATGSLQAQRVADLFAIYCESYRRQAACAASGNHVYALVSIADDGRPGAVRALAETIVTRAREALRTDVVAGIGSLVRSLSDVPASRQEADHVLNVLRERPGPLAADIEEERARVVLRLLTDLARDRPQLRTGRLARLAAQDAAKGTDWIPTLRAYFDAFGDMAAAAAAVGVHPNTFRYRLRRMDQVFALNLDDPDERLVLELQLRFLNPSD